MNHSKEILIIDDEKNIHYSFKRLFSQENFNFSSCYDGEEGLNKICNRDWDLVIMDIRMPKIDGLTLLKRAKEKNPKLVIIIITAHGTTETAIEAMKLGAYDYLIKPFNNDEFKSLITKALEDSERMRESIALQVDVDKGINHEEAIIGKSAIMQDVYKTIGQIAEKDINVLITGESGTGKELVSRAIYSHSKRNNAPFLTVNCAAIPDNLLETELFGHEKGAFTGAIYQHIGKFEKSNGGTLFLDEIGDMNLALQAKLLRVLQTGEYERVGGKSLLKTDVRIIAATNKNLDEEVKNARFRQDLYYRLNVITIHLPPLREKKEDIPLLIDFFIRKFSKKYKKEISNLEQNALKKLINYNFPGNIRELENIINRAVVMSSSDILTENDINLSPVLQISKEAVKKDFSELIEKVFDKIIEFPFENREEIFNIIEKTLIIKALDKENGNQVRASNLLGISRNTLRNRIDRYGLTS